MVIDCYNDATLLMVVIFAIIVFLVMIVMVIVIIMISAKITDNISDTDLQAFW